MDARDKRGHDGLNQIRFIRYWPQNHMLWGLQEQSRPVEFEPGIPWAPWIPFEIRVGDGGELGLRIAQQKIEAVLRAGRLEIVRRSREIEFIAFEVDVVVGIVSEQRVAAFPLA
ncbi:MAG TPA: hypothetical protein VHU22_23340 [Xanthobacteraceae bacterium]|nr:hypothetical protein [Xanthobacteraceae bacterium]